jgi:hypothetical protein
MDFPVDRSAVLRSGARGTWRMRFGVSLLALASLAGFGTARGDEPWIEPGDESLRSDVEILAARGLIDGPTTTWPIPAGEVLSGLDRPGALQGQPDYVQLAAQRVLAALDQNDHPDGTEGFADLRVTNQPDVVRGFDDTARNQSDVDAGLDWSNGSWANARLQVGEQSEVNGKQGKFAADGSYVSAHFSNLLVYGGLVDQWYGPGWESSLILSNNARPFPKLGIMRYDPHAFETPWLSWLGPWQFNFFAGVLDDDRVASDPGYVALRVSAMPITGLEVALSRDMIVCGSGHSCDPAASFFHFDNSNGNPNNDADSATIELKYTRAIGPVLVSPYVQFYNRDNGPFVHSFTSHLAGLSLAGPFGDAGSRWRVTAEETDSIPTSNFLSGPEIHGAAYNNFRYPFDGFHFEDRALGFSLDSDSRLLSLVGSVTDTHGWTYRLAYYHANVNTSDLANEIDTYDAPFARNFVSAEPVKINEIEAGLKVPLKPVDLGFTLRGQDEQVFPRAGATASAEMDISYKFF